MPRGRFDQLLAHLLPHLAFIRALTFFLYMLLTLFVEVLAVTDGPVVFSSIALGPGAPSHGGDPACSREEIIVLFWRRDDTFNEAIEKTHFNINTYYSGKCISD